MADYRRLLRQAQAPLSEPDLDLARRMSGIFWLIGGIVTLLLLPLDPPIEEIGAAGTIFGILGVGVSLEVGLRHLRKEVSLERIYFAGYAGMAMIGALVYLAGGAGSPYHYLYMLPILFAAAAQPPRRVLAFAAFVGVVIWAPLFYEDSGAGTALDIGTQLVTLLAIGSAVWVLFVILRLQRRIILRQRAEAETLAREDSLTGLGNRRAFTEMLELEVARARRGSRPLSVMICDLDDFKATNDRNGHEAGDELLRRAAQRLRHTARQSDACFRWGGDEFSLLLPDTDREQGERLAERIRDAVAEVALPDGAAPLQITCGVAQLVPGQEARGLVARADDDLLERKRAGSGSHLGSG